MSDGEKSTSSARTARNLCSCNPVADPHRTPDASRRTVPARRAERTQDVSRTTEAARSEAEAPSLTIPTRRGSGVVVRPHPRFAEPAKPKPIAQAAANGAGGPMETCTTHIDYTRA